MKPDRIGAVVNPHAGSGNAAELFADLAACFPDTAVDARITTGPDDVPAAAREQADWADLVVSIGGDGTLREVASALVDIESKTPLFVVPAGRGNSTYRHLYGDEDWRAVARRLADGIDPQPLEVGRVEADPEIEPTYFLLGFTAGLFRSALDNAERLRALPGPLAYVLATAGAALVDDPVEASVDVDGERLHDGAARLVAIGGGRYRGSDFALLPDSRPGDGMLHALVVEPAGIRGSLRLGMLARTGRLLEHSAVSYATGERATVRSATGLPVEVDGTPISTPLSGAAISVVPAALSVAYPSG
jgi:diacylglycerol kinase (ATP)